MRRHFCFILVLLLSCTTALARPDYTAELIRLHVVAQDDSEQAQALKLAVRDACLDCAASLLADCTSAGEAYDVLRQHSDDFLDAARQTASEQGYEGSIAAETGIFDFPNRVYGELQVPAGEYRALRITLGEGSGHNWWCVLYPSLCGLDEAEYAAGEEIHFYSSVWRWFRRLFGGESV